MKSKIIFEAASILLTLMFISCSKFENPTLPEAIEPSIVNEYDAMEDFAIALSKAACEHEEIRDLIKAESLKEFDNDYDVLYQNIKNKEISNLGTFRDVLVSYMGDKSFMPDIEKLIPDLTIYVSDVRWLDPQGFCAENWNTKDNRIAVTYKDANGICNKLFSNGYFLGDIATGTIPGGPVLIIKKNERIVMSAPTKSGDVTYSFVDDAYNGSLKHLETKDNRHSGKYSTSWIEGQNPEDNSDIISASALNKLNPDIIKAYNMFKDHPYALQNDYIYYGLTTSDTSGPLRTDVRSKIVRFKIDPNSFTALFDDPNDSDMDFVDSFEADDNGNGYDVQPSTSEIYSKLWADGALEIRVRVLGFSKDGTTCVTYTDYFYDVKAHDLFTIKDNSILQEQWGATAFKWYITWRYSIKKRDETTLVSKWYYPERTLDLPTWDLIENSAFSIVVSEEDTGTQTTYSISITSKKANETTKKVSNELSGNADLGDSGISVTRKEELGWTNSDEESRSGTINLSWVNGNDDMGTQTISYGDKYIESQETATSYKVYSYGSDRFTFTILPYRY